MRRIRGLRERREYAIRVCLLYESLVRPYSRTIRCRSVVRYRPQTYRCSTRSKFRKYRKIHEFSSWKGCLSS